VTGQESAASRFTSGLTWSGLFNARHYAIRTSARKGCAYVGAIRLMGSYLSPNK
jgi:hypothetical protein